MIPGSGRGRARAVRWAAVACAVCLLAGTWWRTEPADLPPYPAAIVLLDRTGQPIRVGPGPDEILCDPIPLDKSGPWARHAIVAVEDKRFYTHPGVDPLAMVRAAGQNLAQGRVVSGASTLSTQLVRMTEPRPRTIRTKLIEAWTALRLERSLDKDALLAQYLNRAPLGGNLYGIQAASRAYFDKDAADLSLAESALLMGLPQSPSRLRPDRHPERAAARRRTVLERMKALGVITDQEGEKALGSPVAVTRRPLPFRAPHFCDLVLDRVRRDGLDPDPGPGRRLTTTLDPRRQALVESVVDGRRREYRARGLDGMAVVVLDVATGDVLALVGSPDFHANRPGAQVNAALARRSPGSTLKPLVYAAALDRGSYIPDTILSDHPLAFADYRPVNMDETHRGNVTLRDALRDSLNLPALRVAHDIGVEPLLRILRRFGLATLDQPASAYGISLALGGAEVCLLDLVTAYAALARGGQWLPYRLTRRQPEHAGRNVTASPATAYLIASILEAPDRSIELAGHGEATRRLRLAWKTGTSSGGRDAWTLAYNPEVVVGVWVGVRTGPAGAGALGVRDAAPLAYQILRRLYPTGRGPWFTAPEEIVQRHLCPDSGQMPGPGCPNRITGPVIAGISHPGLCAVHRDAPPPPPAPLRILSPTDGATYRLTRALPADQQWLPLRSSAATTENLHWFVDGVHLGRQSAGQGSLRWPLTRGPHTIACAENGGRTATARIEVR